MTPLRDKIFSNPLVVKAKQFATDAHVGQTRKDGKTPYITHPEAVAKLAYDFYAEHYVKKLNSQCLFEFTEEVVVEELITLVAAAYLHDVVEDCNVSFDVINDEFNADIKELVWAVTDDKSIKPRILRHYKAANRIYYAGVGDRNVFVLKLCDSTHNLSQLESMSDDFRKTFVVEKFIFVQMMKDWYQIDYPGRFCFELQMYYDEVLAAASKWGFLKELCE